MGTASVPSAALSPRFHPSTGRPCSGDCSHPEQWAVCIWPAPNPGAGRLGTLCSGPCRPCRSRPGTRSRDTPTFWLRVAPAGGVVIMASPPLRQTTRFWTVPLTRRLGCPGLHQPSQPNQSVAPIDAVMSRPARSGCARRQLARAGALVSKSPHAPKAASRRLTAQNATPSRPPWLVRNQCGNHAEPATPSARPSTVRVAAFRRVSRACRVGSTTALPRSPAAAATSRRRPTSGVRPIVLASRHLRDFANGAAISEKLHCS